MIATPMKLERAISQELSHTIGEQMSSRQRGLRKELNDVTSSGLEPTILEELVRPISKVNGVQLALLSVFWG